jgi:hypothetical protein
MPTATLKKDKLNTAASSSHNTPKPRAKTRRLNKTTLDAIREVDGDAGRVYKDAEELYKDLGI